MDCDRHGLTKLAVCFLSAQCLATKREAAHSCNNVPVWFISEYHTTVSCTDVPACVQSHTLAPVYETLLCASQCFASRNKPGPVLPEQQHPQKPTIKINCSCR